VKKLADDVSSGHGFEEVAAALREFRARTGQEPLMLGGWEVEDPAIRPPTTLIEQLRAIRPQLTGYCFPRDFHRARERAAALFAPEMRLGERAPEPANVAILQNSTQGLLLALAALKEHGVARVVAAAPVYFAAVEACRQLGLDVVVVPASDFLTGALDLARLAAEVSVPRSALLLTNPAYSVGVEYTPDHLAALFAALRPETYVLLDETRLGLHWHRPSPWYTAAYPERTLVLRSPSKLFLVNGSKCSLLLGPAALIHEVERLGEALVGSSAGGAEEAALAYLAALRAWRDEADAGVEGPLLAWWQGMVAALGRTYAAVAPTLTSAGFAVSPVDSGPYVLAAIARERLSVLDGAAIGREHGVLLLESAHFFHHHPAWIGFRLNLYVGPARARAALAALTCPLEFQMAAVDLLPLNGRG
jgi:aspartate/methionine/tyrosine aminotransferase